MARGKSGFWPAMFFLLLLICGSLSFGQGASGSDSEIRFGNESIELRFSRQTGRWLATYDRSANKPIMAGGEHLASVFLITDGVTSVTTGRNHLLSIMDTVSVGAQARLVDWHEQASGDMRRLVLRTVEENWTIEQEFGAKRGGDTITRRVRLAWNGGKETLLRWVDLRTPGPVPLAGTILEAPGYPGVLHQPIDHLPTGEWSQLESSLSPNVPGIRPGLLVFRRGDSNLLVWAFDKTIPSLMLISRGDWGVWTTQRLLASCRLQKGQTIEVGTQYIRLQHGDFRDALAKFRRFWDELGVRRIGQTPAWGKDARIYEVHVGPKSFSQGTVYEPYPDLAALVNDLPRIAGMGFNIIQLMPHFPFPSYSVHDYRDIATQYAPEADLRAMIERAHKLGLKVLLDVVFHGVTDKTAGRQASPFDKHPWLVEHPDWFNYTEDGRVARTYTWAFDLASPSLQEFMLQVLRQYVQELDVDGFRADALTWNFFPNWAKGLPRPGYQSFYGSVPMFERVREQLLKIKPELLFYTETGGPLYHPCFDVAYAYDEQPFYPALLPVVSKRGYATTSAGLSTASRKVTARQLAEWLDLRQRVLPEGWLRVHQADSHDSHEWGGLGMFRKEAFGVDGARLLFAFSSFIDGGVMNYVGAEAGSEEFYRKVLSLRKSIPALREGSCDYLAVRPSDNRIFAPLRRYQDEGALPLLSFSAERINTQVPLSELGLKPEATYTLQEALSNVKRTGKGKQLLRLSVVLQPFGVQLWTIKQTR